MTDIIERLWDAQRRIGTICSKQNGQLRMTIPANPERDDDLVLLDTIMAAAKEIERLRAEIARRDLFAGCDGCSTGDCPHDTVHECCASQAATIREQAAVIASLDDEITRLKRSLRTAESLVPKWRPASEDDHVIIDVEDTMRSGVATFWRFDERGYTTDLCKAGLYTEARAKHIVSDTHGAHAAVRYADMIPGSYMVVDAAHALGVIRAAATPEAGDEGDTR